MRLKALIVALAALAGCSAEVNVDENSASTGDAAAQGYTMEIFAHENEQIYLVSHEDGRAAAARVVDTTSSNIEASEARALLNDRQAALGDPGEEVVGFRAPGFRLSIKGDEADGDNNDSVEINVETPGGGVSIDARDDGANDRARVRITGADEGAARNFINDLEDVSPEVKAAMLAELGLSAT